MEIDIYTSPLCGFCTIAKNLLAKKGIDFNEYDVLRNPSLKPIMIERANGSNTVPQIFINEQHIGGCEQLFKLDQNGKLDEILGQK
tara:strand:+ start:132 stop:389 length:258 start_codon:yes stop_codon:yes gene_type:complete